MTALIRCPHGHDSANLDFCDTCGCRLPPESAGDEVPENLDACPRCTTARCDDDAFCEHCGHRFGDVVADAPTDIAWELVMSADRAYYERIAPAGVEFPSVPPKRVIPLSGDEVSVGRRSDSLGITPDVDCSVLPVDPGVSHRHAVLVRDGAAYAVRDLGSTNGTMLNDDPDPISKEEPATLRDGDRIHIGAWTTLTIRARTTTR